MTAIEAKRGLYYKCDAEKLRVALGKLGVERNLSMSGVVSIARVGIGSIRDIEAAGRISSVTLKKLCLSFNKEPEFFGADLNAREVSEYQKQFSTLFDEQATEAKTETVPVVEERSATDIQKEIVALKDELADITGMLNACKKELESTRGDFLQVLNRMEAEDKRFHKDIGSQVVTAIIATLPHIRIDDAISSGYTAIRKMLKRDVNAAIKGDLK